jgi:hypothetical protein
MIPKSGSRFSEKIMRKQKGREPLRQSRPLRAVFGVLTSRSSVTA